MESRPALPQIDEGEADHEYLDYAGSAAEVNTSGRRGQITTGRMGDIPSESGTETNFKWK